MSYPYRVRVAKTVEADVRADDKVVNKLNIDDILGETEMVTLLEEALERRGYEKDEDGKWVKELEDGERRVVDLEAKEVTTTVVAEDKIKKEKTLEVVGDAYNRADRDAQRERQKQEAEARLERSLKITDDEVAEKRRELVKKIGEQLEGGSEARTQELMELVAEVQAEALKKKAASLGTVVSVEESRSADGGEYELRIRISE